MKQREIKFRVYHKADGMKYFGDTPIHILLNGDVYYDEVKEHYKLDSHILMQYTGFKDANGKDIFEGDIVKIEKIDGTTYNAQVRFFKGAFCIHTTNVDINVKNVEGHNVIMHIDFDWSDQQSFYEVIGNIYENAGLLAVTPKGID